MKYLENEEEFDKVVNKGKVLVDFYADWCGPCRMLSQVIEVVANNHKDLQILKVNIDNFPSIAKRFGVMSIPTLKIFEDGNEKKSSIGFIGQDELEDFIK